MSDDEKIAEIKERHFHDERWRNGPSMGFETICPQTHDDRAFLLAEVERLRAENEKLREALRWYADPKIYFPVHVYDRRSGYPHPVAVFVKEPQIMDECGRRARAALEGKP